MGQKPPRDEGRHWPCSTRDVSHEERVAAGQREGVAVGARGPRIAKSALGPRALGEFPWSKVLTYNLAHDSSHDPAHDPTEGDGGRVAVT